jgi:hypothetical protein
VVSRLPRNRYNDRELKFGALAEKLGSGLQNRVDGSVTRRCLHILFHVTAVYPSLFHKKFIFVLYNCYMGKVRSWTDEQLIEAVKVSRSNRQVLLALRLIPAGGNYEQIKRRIRELELPIEHFTGKGWNVGIDYQPRPQRPLEELLVIGGTSQSHKLKQRLFREGVKLPSCELCDWAEMSLDGRIPVELDHINGDHYDNRIENLRILCPNCHSLQLTHRGRNKKVRLRNLTK